MVEEDPNIAGVGLAYIGTAATLQPKGNQGVVAVGFGAVRRAADRGLQFCGGAEV